MSLRPPANGAPLPSCCTRPGRPVIATRGRLYDLPAQGLGVSLENFEIESRVWLDPSLCDRLRSSISAASCVFLMTDDDEEGEWIASQVTELEPHSRYVRTPLPALSVDSLRSALSEPRQLDHARIRAAQARRIADRVIGYTLSSNDYDQPLAGSVGRILSPTLQALALPGPRGCVTRPVVGKDGHWYEVSVPLSGDPETDSALISLVRDLPAPVIEPVSQEPAPAPLPMTGPQALAGCCDAIGLAPHDAAAELQAAYENSLVSYPRSDAYYLTEERISELGQTAAFFGIKGFKSSTLRRAVERWERGPASIGAHHAVVPVGPVRPAPSRSGATTQTLIRHYLARRSVHAGVDADWQLRRGRIAEPHGASDWAIVLRDLRERISVSSVSYTLGPRAPIPVLPHSDPLGFGDRETVVTPLDGQRLVLDRLMAHELGRPSTLAYHSKHIADAYLRADSSISKRALQALQRVRQVCPRLLEPAVQQRLHQEIFSTSEKTSEQRCRQVMAELGLDVASLTVPQGPQAATSPEPDIGAPE